MSNLSPSKGKVNLNNEDAWIFGVCAGLADYISLDPAIIRVATIVAGLFMPKIMVGSYLVAWLILNGKVIRK